MKFSSKDCVYDSPSACNGRYKNMKKRFFLFTLFLALAFVTLLSFTAVHDASADRFNVDNLIYETTSKNKVKLMSCERIGDIDIPSMIKHLGKSYKVTSIDKLAFACDKLKTHITSVTIPDSIRSSIGEETFCNCSALTSVTIGGGIKSIGEHAFQGCISMKSVTIGKNVRFIEMGAFKNCESLMSITIPNKVEYIGSFAFYNCSSLTSVTIPDSVTSCGGSTFQDCTSLKTVCVGNSVTNIGWMIFKGCKSLTSVTVGTNVKSFGTDAFKDCSELKTLYILGTKIVVTISESSFKNCKELQNIYVPIKMYEKYRDAESWSSMRNYLMSANEGPVARNIMQNDSINSVTEMIVCTTICDCKANCARTIH